MSKTIKNSFNLKLTFEKMLDAYKRTYKNKIEAYKFEMDLETNITNIINEIEQGKYKIGKYTSFVIKEPKERIIRKLPFKDRIVQQWYIEEFIKPYFDKRFIFDTYACIKYKGNHKCVKRLQKFMKNKGKCYFLKCDIKKFFDNINSNIMFEIMTKYISDKKLLEFTKLLIFENNEKGLPIGNYTSQYFANIYLN